MIEDYRALLNAFGEPFEFINATIKGILGTDIASLSGGKYEIYSQDISSRFYTPDFRMAGVGTGDTCVYTKVGLSYHLTISTYSDTLDGWTEVFFTVSTLEEI